MFRTDKRSVLFGYACFPSYGCPGEYGGCSFEMYSDGTLIYKTYVIEEAEKTHTVYSVPVEAVNEIKTVLKDYADDIKGFQKHTDNGSDDGSHDVFIFSRKKFYSLNARYTSEKELAKYKGSSQYYEHCISSVMQENMMIEIFLKLYEILNLYVTDFEGIDIKNFGK